MSYEVLGKRRLGRVRLDSSQALADVYAAHLVRRAVFVSLKSPPALGSSFDLQLECPQGLVRLTVAVRYVAEPKSGREGCGVEVLETKATIAARVSAVVGELPGAPVHPVPVLALQFDDVASATGHSGRPRAVVVEDDAELQQFYIKLLEPGGFAVTCLRDGVQAVEAHAKQPFDLIVIEYLLPRLDGLRALEKMLKQRSAPVIFVSAVVRDQKIAMQVRNLGVHWMLEKPLRLDQVRRALDEAMQAARASQASSLSTAPASE